MGCEEFRTMVCDMQERLLRAIRLSEKGEDQYDCE